MQTFAVTTQASTCKRGIAESLHTHINRARTVCEVSIFEKEYHNFQNTPPPTLKFIAMGKFPEIM